MPKVVREFTDAHLAHAVKIVGVSDDLAKVAACETAAQQALGRRRAPPARSLIISTSPTRRPTRARWCETLAKLSAISGPREIATIGDMPNDVLMFRKSGLSIAMGNASDEVKSQAS